MMKKIYFLFILIAGLSAFSSCSKVEELWDDVDPIPDQYLPYLYEISVDNKVITGEMQRVDELSDSYTFKMYSSTGLFWEFKTSRVTSLSTDTLAFSIDMQTIHRGNSDYLFKGTRAYTLQDKTYDGYIAGDNIYLTYQSTDMKTGESVTGVLEALAKN